MRRRVTIPGFHLVATLGPTDPHGLPGADRPRGGLNPGGANVQVRTSGISSLLAKVTVYDLFGRVIGTAVDTNPLNDIENLIWDA